MLNNLIFSLNATLPVFLLMVLGMFLRRVGLLTEDFAGKMNSFVFKVSLPVLLFYDSAKNNFLSFFDGSYVLFCFFATAIEIAVSFFFAHFMKDRSEKGEFIQACFRSSAALLGVVFAENIYGDTKILPLMILGAVPLYNIMSVVILQIYQPDRVQAPAAAAGEDGTKASSAGGLDRALVKQTLKGIVTNPIILGILAGLLWSLFRLPLPAILDRTCDYVGRVASPLGLLALGAQFDFRAAAKDLKPALFASFMKLFGFAAVILPIAIHMGFLGEKLVSLIIMAGSPTTVTAFVMAKGFGHKGTLSASCVMLTTLISAFSLTLWVFLARTHGWL